MGRPLNKKFFGTGEGDHFVVLAKVGEDAATAEIVKQTGTKRFIVATEDATGVCVLVDKAVEDLEIGEMVIQATNADDETQNVKVIKGRTAVLADGTIHPWSFAEAEDARVQIVAGEIEDEPATPVITITVQPADISVEDGQPASFAVEATVTEGATLSYEWQARLGEGAFMPITDATSATHNILSVSEDETGKVFRCVVSATGGAVSVNSEEATLTVTPAV